MIIVIDGPENSGKSTVARKLDSLETGWMHQTITKQSGRALPNEDIYIEDLYNDLYNNDLLTIWDRSWISEYVYGRILNQDRPIAIDPFIGFWKFDRFVIGNGVSVILSGEDVYEMELMRDSSDIQTDSLSERILFEDYADTFGLMKIRNFYYGETEIETIARKILIRGEESLYGFDRYRFMEFPFAAGNRHSKTWIVESRKTDDPKKIVPFVDKMCPLRRLFGDRYLINSFQLNYVEKETLIHNTSLNQFYYPDMIYTNDKELYSFFKNNHVKTNFFKLDEGE